MKRRLLSQRTLISHRSYPEAQGENIPSEYNTVKQIASLFEHILPKDEEVQQEVRKLLANTLQRKKNSWKQSKIRYSELRNLESIDPKSGNVLKGNTPVKDQNIYQDLNYGDFLLAF